MRKNIIAVIFTLVLLLLLTQLSTVVNCTVSNKTQLISTISQKSINDVGKGDIDTTPPIQTFEFGEPKTTIEWYGKTYTVISDVTHIWINSTDPSGTGCEKITYSLWKATSPYPNQHGSIDMVWIYEKTISDGTLEDKDPAEGEVSVQILIKRSCLYEIRFQCWDYDGNTDGEHFNDFLVDCCTPVTSLTVGQPHYIENRAYWVNTVTPLWFNSTDKSYLPEETAVDSLIIDIYWKRNLSDPYEPWQLNTTITIHDGDSNDKNVKYGKITYEFYFNDGCCHKLKWCAIDVLGNIETEKKTKFKVDVTPPKITTTIGDPNSSIIPGKEYKVTPQTPITFAVRDGGCMGGVGLKIYEYNIYYNKTWQGWIPGNQNGVTLHILEEGLHFLLIRATDYVENIANENLTFVVNNTILIINKIVGDPHYLLEDDNYIITNHTPIMINAWSSGYCQSLIVHYKIDDNNWIDISDYLPYNLTIRESGTHQLSIKANDCFGNTAFDNETFYVNIGEPYADAGGPYTAVVYEQILFDASRSYDMGGVIIGYRWDFENDNIWDTTWLTTPTILYSYTSPGSYTVRLQVVDNKTAADEDTALVTIISESPANHPPYIPSNPNPPNNATNIGIYTDLWWHGGDPDNNPVTYDVFFGTTNPPPKISSNQSETTYNLGPLMMATHYYWQIIARDNFGTITLGPIWSFTTSTKSNLPPQKPMSPIPTNGSTDLDTSVLLSVYVSDPNGDSIVVQFYDKDNHILIGSTIVPNGSHASILWSGLQFSDTYHWYTIANDTILSNISDFWSFTIKTLYGGGGGSQNKPPIADLSAGEPYQGIVGEPITFSGSKSYDSDGTIISWRWTFGDGLTENGKVVTHAYSHAGIFTVALTVKDNQNEINSAITNAIIIRPNQPPTKPEITGIKNGIKNTNYAYIATSTDPDNDSIRYSFDWGDQTSPDVGGFVTSGTPFTIYHRWNIPGFYTITGRAFDNKTESEPTYYTINIDVEYVGNFGYLINHNSNNSYDSFYSNQTKNETKIEKQDNGTYLIDTNDDGKYDYLYNPRTKQLTQYLTKEEGTIQNDISMKILGGILGIIVVLLLLILLLTRKKKTKSIQPSVQPVKSESSVQPVESESSVQPGESESVVKAASSKKSTTKKQSAKKPRKKTKK